MLFKPEHIPMILSGKKTMTRRAWEKPMVKINGIYKCKTKLYTKESFATIRVTDLYEERLGDITEEDCHKEGYDNLEAFKDIWKKINGDWDSAKFVWVIEFELI